MYACMYVKLTGHSRNIDLYFVKRMNDGVFPLRHRRWIVAVSSWVWTFRSYARIDYSLGELIIIRLIKYFQVKYFNSSQR